MRTRMRVLEVRRTVALETEHLAPVKHHIHLAILAQHSIDHRADTHHFCKRVCIVSLYMPLVLSNHLFSPNHRLIQHMLESENIPFAGAHLFVFKAHSPKNNVLQLRKIPTQLSERGKELLKVVLLCDINDVEYFLGVERIDAIARRSQIACEVDRRVISLENNSRREL